MYTKSDQCQQRSEEAIESPETGAVPGCEQETSFLIIRKHKNYKCNIRPYSVSGEETALFNRKETIQEGIYL